MGLFDKVSSFMKREAEDIGEVAGRARDRLDKELTEREAELEMTPAEKLRALQRQARQNDERIDDIMEKAGASSAVADARAEVRESVAPAQDREPPSVTQIVLADGSVRSGDDPELEDDGGADDEPDPDEGDLAWVAPREGEEAVVPAFSASVGTAAPSGSTPGIEEPNGSDEPAEVAEAEVAEPDTAEREATQLAPVEHEPTTPPKSPAAVEPTPERQALDQLPPPPPPPEPDEPAPAPTPEPAGAPVADQAPRRETPAEIAGRVVAELEQAVAEDPTPASEPQAAVPQPKPAFDKTPAQRKYEEARKAADALLEELRGELKDDGQI